MKNKKLLFAALFLAALAFGFVGCENPGDLLNNGDDSSITDNDSTTNNPNQGDNSNNGDESERPIPDISSTLVATGAASDVEYSNVTLWGRINTDTLWAFSNIKWGIECSTSKEEMQSHKGKKVLCTTDLVGENTDEYSVAFTELTGGKMLYYNAYLVINDMKYIYGEVDSVHLDVKLTLNRNNTSYGTVTGSGTYDHLAEATITATPKENYYFTSWSDGNTENPRTVVVNSDTTFTANFTKKPYLTVKSNNTFYGTVTGSGYYMPGDEVTITATLKDNCYFTGWSDCDSKELTRTITLTSDSTITANFTKKPYLTVETNNSDYGYGTVTGSGYYMPGSEVTITATPEENYCFTSWSDGNTDNPRTVVVTSDTTFTANFDVDVVAWEEQGYTVATSAFGTAYPDDDYTNLFLATETDTLFLSLNTEGEETLTVGEYTMDDSGEYPAGTWDPVYSMLWNVAMLSDGTVSVTKAGRNYTVKTDCVDENGDSVKWVYVGQIDLSRSTRTSSIRFRSYWRRSCS